VTKPIDIVRYVIVACVAMALGVSVVAHAEEVPVPVALQAELLAKVAGYDKNLPARAGEKVHIALLEKSGNADSARVVAQMASALDPIGPIADLPHDQVVVRWAGAAALATLIHEKHVAIVFVSPGFSEEIGAIRAALDGIDVLTVSAVPDHVPRGIVLGFDLMSGKPKLLVNLTQARKQNVALKAQVLKMMRVYE
jgi:hypothetical protein